MSLLIREAAPPDRAEVVELWRACGLTRPWNDAEADFDLALGSPGSTILIAGAPVEGAVMAGFDGHRGWVYYLGVAPARRRGGLGRALMQAAETWLTARGAPKIQLMVRSDNPEVLAFHEALGLSEQAVVVMGRRLG
ncbi:GNAT family acetyltransferase [Brevundimonas sp. VNH65]|uniref:GNAT family acetyltransferase n=1 Tax=Brevundimonas sp. VNH65 TaxID=3400917 RepID=UPI003C04CF95